MNHEVECDFVVVQLTMLAMCSYNKVGNTTDDARWSCENPSTLGRDLKERIGFRHGVPQLLSRLD